MNNSTATDVWMTVKQAAEYLGVSEPTIFRWMRDGTLSFFKIGGATRFRRENLDLVARKVTGKQEGAQRAGRCAVCGHGFLIPGSVRSTGKIYFLPKKTKFFVLSESVVDISAQACPICGHIEMFADRDKLEKLMPREDAKASRQMEEMEADDTDDLL